MKALQLQAVQTLVSIQAPLPDVGPGEVLLRVKSCALCRTDAKMWRQGHRDLILPRVPGHEICGEIDDESDLFVVWPGSVCGECPDCVSATENLCSRMRISGFHRDGGLAEYIAVPESSLIRAPSGLTPEIACLAEPLACTLNALELVGLSPKEHVLIHGAGPVGLLMGLAARSFGAAPLIIEKDPEKLSLSARFRIAAGIPAVHETQRTDFHVAVNAAPSLEAFRDGMRRLRSGGRYCLFSGLPTEGSVDSRILNEIHYRQLRCVGAYGCTSRQMEEALALLRTHASEVACLIQEQITLEQVPAALSRILDGHVLKFIVQLNQ
ncbi:MAG: alcohol dehydrogenase catalytic domain-containing protein [Syntrophobacteraceae bacterium]